MKERILNPLDSMNEHIMNEDENLSRESSINEMPSMNETNWTVMTPTPRMGALESVFTKVKDIVDAPNISEDHRTLIEAVAEGDIETINKLKKSQKVTTEEILKAAIDRDEVSILEEFHSHFENNDSLDHLIDHSIKKNAMRSARKISDHTQGLPLLKLLEFAITTKQTDFALKILDSGDVDVSSMPETPLHLAARTACSIITHSLALRNITWVHQGGKGGATPLHVAAQRGCNVVCQALLEHGARVEALDGQGRTPLHCCVGSPVEGSTECIEVLLKHKTPVNVKDDEGLTPLHIAAMRRKKAHVKLLISHNAHMDSQTPNGETALEIIARNVPSAIEEFNKRLDKGITLEDPKNETKIRLDFRKLFSVTEVKSHNVAGNMAIFKNLENSSFVNIVEHPLVKAFLVLKMKQVRLFYFLLLCSHFIFSLVFSVYCCLLFSVLCPPDPETMKLRKDLTSNVSCNATEENKDIINTINVSWVFLTIFLPVFILRETMKMSTDRARLRRTEALRNGAMTIMMVAVIYTGGLFNVESDNYLYRWQYYVVSSSCFLLWIEMMVMIGRVPMFGKYVQMYRSVALEMGKFAVAYLPLLIGFMVMFIIMFSDQESFNSNFLGVVGKILVMMTGEFDYQDLKYQTEEKISNDSTIIQNPQYNQFPGMAHLTILCFILSISIVMMNLLVALAVNDITKLSKTAKRDQLLAQIELINYVEKFISSRAFSYFPVKLQELIKNRVLQVGRGFPMTPVVEYASVGDTTLSQHLKAELYEHCMRREKQRKYEKREQEKEDRRDKLEEKYDALIKLIQENTNLSLSGLGRDSTV